MKKKIKLLSILLLVMFTFVNKVNAGVSGSSIHAGSSKSGAPGAWTCKKTGLSMSASGSFTGYRLTVVRVKDKEGTFDKILYQQDYLRKGNYKYANGGGVAVFINKNNADNGYYKTRFGLVKSKKDENIKWRQVDSNRKYYNSSKKTTLLTGDYDWKQVAKHYNEIAGSYSKTIKLLKSYKIDVSNYGKTTVTTSKCPDGSEPVNNLCKSYSCDSSKAPAGTTGTGITLAYDPKAYNKGYCVSYAGSPTVTYTFPTAPAGHTYTNKNTATGTYTDNYSEISGYEYSCSDELEKKGYKLSGSTCVCKKCKNVCTGSGKKKKCVKKDIEEPADAAAKYTSKSVAKQAPASYTCPKNFRSDNAHVNCVFVHGYDKNPGTTTLSADLRKEDTTIAPVEACITQKSEIQKLWIIIEPMFSVATCATGSQRTYFGTATEISKITAYGIEDDSGKRYKNAFSDFRSNYGLWGGFLYMKKDSFKNEDKETYKFSKLISKTSSDDYNSDGWYKHPENMYKKDSETKSVKGAGVGIVWLGEATKGDLDDECKKGYFCESDPSHEITSCVSKYTTGQGINLEAAQAICEIEECGSEDDKTDVCDVCDDDGREEQKKYTNLLNDLINSVKKENIKTKAAVYEKVTALKTAWENKWCITPTYKQKVEGDKFTCENKYRNEDEVKVGTQAANGETNKTCETLRINRNGTYLDTLGNCSIYCTEKANLVFPGNVEKAILASDSFEWPSKTTDDYKMEIKYDVTCTAINNTGKSGESCNRNIDSSIFANLVESNSKSLAKLTYKNKTYSFNSLDLTTDKIGNDFYQTKKRGSDWNNNTSIALNDGDMLKISSYYKYYLPEELYYHQDQNRIYFNKNATSGAVLPLKDIGVGRLATERVSPGTFGYSESYKDGLRLDVTLGKNNSIGSVITNYVCKYNVYDVPGDCVCPTGTEQEGKSLKVLEECIDGDTDSSKTVCSEYVEKYCNLKEWPNSWFESCKCENCDNKVTDIRECLKNNNNAYDYCYYVNCRAKECGNCYSWTDCEYDYDNKVPDGLNYYMVYKYCYPSAEKKQKKEGGEQCGEPIRLYCPDGNCDDANKDKVIYRTVDVSNPFPGQGNDGLTTKFSSTNTKGRYPGGNWDNINWVKNKITNVKIINNGTPEIYNGNEIYTKKEPLYTITLTPELMRKIRADLNEKYDYSDFSILTCAKTKNNKCEYYYNKNLRDILGDKFAGECKGSDIESCYMNNSSTGNTYYESNQ